MESLTHEFFDELRDESCKLPNGNALPDLFNFTKEENSMTDQETMEKLVPAWYKGGD